MIKNDVELQATQQRIEWFERQVVHLRTVETDPVVFRMSAGGFIVEISRMQLEVREYLGTHPSELAAAS